MCIWCITAATYFPKPLIHWFSKLIHLIILIISILTGKESQTLTQGLANLKRQNPEPVLWNTAPHKTEPSTDESSSAERGGSGARLFNLRFEFEKSLGPTLSYLNLNTIQS